MSEQEYTLNEGSIKVPTDWNDQSTNVFVDTGPMSTGGSFVITRDKLPWGLDLEEYGRREVKKMSKQLAKFKLEEETKLEIAGLPAQAVQFNWKQSNGTVLHQIIAYLVYLDNKIFTYTISSPGKMPKATKKGFFDILSTIQFNQQSPVTDNTQSADS